MLRWLLFLEAYCASASLEPSQRTEVEGVTDWPSSCIGEKGTGDLPVGLPVDDFGFLWSKWNADGRSSSGEVVKCGDQLA